jgi:hypothetical protein
LYEEEEEEERKCRVRNNESLYDKRIHFASLLLRVVPAKDRTNDVYKKT